MAKLLVTGAAGFIGMHLSLRLLERGDEVLGIDNLNDYYDPSLKQARLARLQGPGFRFVKADLACRSAMESLFQAEAFDGVVNLAAQAGVRYSLDNPHVYVESNVVGFLNILEGCRRHPPRHLVFASSSSVYGNSFHIPFSVNDNVDHPVSLYAATKKSNELMAHTYSHLFGIPVTGLRFFTVYGPWGRPDMAYFSFTKAILEGRSIDVFNHGKLQRDFTYVDDIVEGVIRVLDRPPAPNPAWEATPEPSTSSAPYRIYNIGNHQPVELKRFIETLERCLGREAIKRYLPHQPGDVFATYADIEQLTRDTGFQPTTSIEDGLARFVDWYSSYYHVERGRCIPPSFPARDPARSRAIQ
jgi:UDP-glucuronate 4-epimerase